jgi:O-antigen ligase
VRSFAPLPLTIAGAVGANLLVALLAVREPSLAVLAVAAPAAIAFIVALAASDRSILFFAALAVPVSLPVLNRELAFGSAHIYASDIIVVVALVAWVAGRLAAPDATAAPTRPRLPFRFSFALFTLVIVADAVRGHHHYGASLVGEPMRLAAYALLAFAISDLTPGKAYRGLVAVFYGGAFWSLLEAMYYIATGTSQTNADELSTGGTRVLALSTSLYLAATLFLALLSFDLERTRRQRMLDGSAAAAALVGIVLSFGRGTFLAVIVVVPLLLLASPRLRERAARALPLLLVALVAAAALTADLAPGTWKTLGQRVQIGVVQHSSDPSVEWRQDAVHTIWQQVRASPIVGVGFGKGGEFTLHGTTYVITQDPHNSFVWLAAGGGFVLVALFACLIFAYIRDVLRRLRVATHVERVLLVWAVGTFVCFVLNALAGPLFSTPSSLLAVWAMFLLPQVTTPPAATAAEPAPRARAERRVAAPRAAARPGAAASAPR